MISPDVREMRTADDWLHGLIGPPAGWKKQSATKLFPELIEPPFSFIYGSRRSAGLLRAWKLGTPAQQPTAAGMSYEVTYTDPQTNLVVRLVALRYRQFPAVEWLVYFKNSGDADTLIIEDIQALDTKMLSPQAGLVIHYANGGRASAVDFMPLTRLLGKRGRLHVEPSGGRSSSLFMPFFNMEAKGEGIVVAIGWTGEWAMNFSNPKGTSVQMRSGMAHTHLKLHPGEEIRTPRVLTLFWRGAPLRGNNQLRRLLLLYHRPSAGGKLVRMPICNSNWGATPSTIHLENIRQIVHHKLPMDYYWIDAGWFGKGPWWTDAGDWQVKKDLYPRGFKPISDALHRSGRKFLLWFEPERVCAGTPWYTEHAEWLLSVPEDKKHFWGFGGKGDLPISQSDPCWVFSISACNQLHDGDKLFNLAIPEARRFLTDFMSAKIDEFGIDCFRHDANIAPLEFWRAADEPDRQGMTEIRWIEGLYAFWDGLKQRHPNLVIDVCASGGRRLDLETLSRCLPLWRTDFPNGDRVKQCQTYGLTFWVPLNGTSAGNLGSGTTYDLRSSMSSGLDYGLLSNDDHAQTQTDYAAFPFGRTKSELEQQRMIENYFYGDYYPLTQYSQAEDVWEAYQLDITEKQEGLIVVLKRPLSDYVSATFPLMALDPRGSYEIDNIDTGERRIVAGRDLASRGLELTLLKRPDSALIRYRHT